MVSSESPLAVMENVHFTDRSLSGGGFQLVVLHKVLVKMLLQDTPPSLPPTALVLDSVPGERNLDTMIMLLAPINAVLRLLAISLIALLYLTLSLSNMIMGQESIFDELRAVLHAPDVLPALTSAASPRLYLYSSADKLVLAPWVETHIEEARALKLDIDAEKFTSPHVAHARSDPERYWGAIHRLGSGR